MIIYTISDLHLPLGIDKPMDIFGRRWENYVEKTEYNWKNTVKEDDLVILGGDFSWATYLEESEKDFEFLNDLPGQKILLKGNHDYWWTTHSKLKKFMEEKKFSTVSFLHNNSYLAGNIGICGTRGWSLDSITSAEDKKIYERELLRLKLSIDDAKGKGAERIFVFTHFPPVTEQLKSTAFHRILAEEKVERCVYGHLHGISHKNAFEGIIDGVEYTLASGDYTGFELIKLEEI